MWQNPPMSILVEPNFDPPVSDLEIPEQIAQRIEDVQSELDGLRNELNVLRRRDETLNFYMARLDEELRLAARIQQDFLPKTLPQIGNVHFHTLFRPAGYVSGDLYDVIRLDERHIAFYIADAVGHGMPAALLTMFLKHSLVTKEIGPDGYRLLPPSETMRRLNESFVSQQLTHASFATALCGIIDVTTSRVTLARAGHPLPLLLRANGTIERIDCDGGLLGVFPDEIYAETTTNLDPGDRLVLFTDGVEMGFGGNAAATDAQWRSELLSHRHLDGSELLAALSRTLDDSIGSLDPKDDLTIIVVENCAAA
jgi:sigma-B regulation protein RsbU (phosphoserine phosphatase)